MGRAEFKRIRIKLGLSQHELAIVLGLSHPISVSNYERDTNPRKVPFHLELIMQALEFGFRPATWGDMLEWRSRRKR